MALVLRQSATRQWQIGSDAAELAWQHGAAAVVHRDQRLTTANGAYLLVHAANGKFKGVNLTERNTAEEHARQNQPNADAVQTLGR